VTDPQPGQPHRTTRTHPPRDPTLVPNEAGAFLDAIADDPHAPLYELILLEGLRRGEAAGLRWDDLTIDNAEHGTGILRIRRQRVDVAGRIHETPPKTRSGERRIELGRRSVHLLLAHRTAQTKQRLAAERAWADTGYIFTNTTGRPLRPETITRPFRRLTTAAGVRPIRVHDLRHLSASLQIQAGVSITLISKRLGHSTTRITGDIYGHILPGAGHAASNAAEALIPPASSSGSLGVGRRALQAGCGGGHTELQKLAAPAGLIDHAMHAGCTRGQHLGNIAALRRGSRSPSGVKAQVRHGAACRNRTDDLLITSEPLCRLS
jgi:hypothetical protein